MTTESNIIIKKPMDMDIKGVIDVQVWIQAPVDPKYLSFLTELSKEFEGSRISYPMRDCCQFLSDNIYYFYVFRFYYFEAAEGFYHTILLG